MKIERKTEKIRVLVQCNNNDATAMEEALDNKFISYDYDEGGRLMIPSDQYEDAAKILNELGLDYDVI